MYFDALYGYGYEILFRPSALAADGIVLKICWLVGGWGTEHELRAIDCSVVVKISGFLDQLFTLMNNITNLE